MCRGGARHFHLGGPLEGPVLQQGELSMVCVGLQCSVMTSRGKFWKGHWGTRQNFGGAVAPPGNPLAPPLLVSVSQTTRQRINYFYVNEAIAISEHRTIAISEQLQAIAMSEYSPRISSIWRWYTAQRCTESEIFVSDSVPASAEYTPTALRHILKVWTPTPA